MQASSTTFAALEDQFLVAYACTSSVDVSDAALFNVGHAAELYLKAVICAVKPGSDPSVYGHNVAKLLREVQAKVPGLISRYVLRQRAIDKYLTNASLPPETCNDPDYDHFNEHRELYWISTYLMDTKYLFASHRGGLAGKSFVLMKVGLNDYWQPFFKELRAYLTSQGVVLSTGLTKILSNPHLPASARAYLLAIA